MSIFDEGPTATNPTGHQRDGDARPEPALFLAFTPEQPLEPAARWRLGGVSTVEIGRARAPRTTARTLSIQLPDRFLSTNHARLVLDGDEWSIQDGGSKNGSIVNGHAVKSATLADRDVIELGRSFFVYRDTRTFGRNDLPFLRADLSPDDPLSTMIPDLARTLGELAQVARADASVIIGGQTGTGKEIAARAVHEISRRPGEFMAVNCAAIPEHLVASELFGYRAGAFSGAREDRPGLICAAEHGTLFLDEIGDLSPAAQAAILRVLEDRHVLAVGATKPRAVDVRVVCASHRDLGALVRAGTFRADLLARLSGYRLELPALRDRREDFGLIVARILRARSTARGATTRFDLDASRALMRYDWPLNIRELVKCIETAQVLAGAEPIACRHLPEEMRPADDERGEMIALLRRHDGNVSSVARTLRKERKQVQRVLKRLGIEPENYRT